MLRDGKETPAPQRTETPTAEQPPTPRWPPPGPVTQAPPPALGRGYPAGPYDQAPIGGYQAPMGAYQPEETYRFRPLAERERRRIEEQARGPYGRSYPSAGDTWEPQQRPSTGSSPAYGVDPTTRDPWMRDWGAPGWGTEGYGFRQPSSVAPGGERWQGPYSTPVQPGDWLPPEPGVFQGPNQWGAIPPERTPPSYRMYPSLEGHRDRRLTAR